ncbi:hypothetical protein FWC63_00895 [Candidatus Saccharibacteria bacterium]|nr:hypothetical protein [Candidatus Saccharibacteria bacterium]
MTTKGIKKKGAVSLYIVLFATLLVTVIALGFTRIMMNERRQVSDTDLSQTAYDSAMTGIEDARLAVIRYNECLTTGNPFPAGNNTRSCADIISVMRTGQPVTGTINVCDQVSFILGRPGINETPIHEGGFTGDGTFEQTDQAYTCVRISDDTINFLSQLDAQTRSRLIPLRTGGIPFNQVVISWSRARNFAPGANPIASLSSVTSGQPPISFPASWPADAPPVLSASIMQSGSNFNLSSFETAQSGNTNRAAMMLVPVSSGGIANNTITAAQVTATNNQTLNNPFPVNCVSNFGFSGGYSCSVTINLPAPIGGGARHDGTSFLQLESIFPITTHDFQVTVRDTNQAGSPIVPLVGVQVAVDSTGRNSDALRRIEGRIEVVDTAFPFPEWTVQLNGETGASFCKNFIVTINNWVTGQDVFNNANC